MFYPVPSCLQTHTHTHIKPQTCFFFFAQPQESEQSIAKGNIPLDKDNNSYSLRQKAVVLKRAAAAADSPPEEPAALAENTPSLATAEAPAVSPGDSHLAELPLSATAQAPASAGGSAREAGDGSGRRELPEIIMFWGRNKRRGGNLVVCPAHSMDQLIEAYLVCEVVEQSIKVGWVRDGGGGCSLGVSVRCRRWSTGFVAARGVHPGSISL